MVVDKKHQPQAANNLEKEQNWENPVSPEEAGDVRDQEQLQRQKKEAERRKENLSDDQEQ